MYCISVAKANGYATGVYREFSISTTKPYTIGKAAACNLKVSKKIAEEVLDVHCEMRRVIGSDQVRPTPRRGVHNFYFLSRLMFFDLVVHILEGRYENETSR